VSKFLYLTENKPSRKASRQFATWLADNYPECSFVEINVSGRSHPPQNYGRYQGRVEGPDAWADEAHTEHRQAVFAAARRMLVD
jgi:hypothetical protein